jgi:hypothetical protein
MAEDSRRMFDAFQEQNKTNEQMFNRIGAMIDRLPVSSSSGARCASCACSSGPSAAIPLAESALSPVMSFSSTPMDGYK